MAPAKGCAMKPSGASVRQEGERVTKQARELAGSIGQTRDSAAHRIQDTLRRTQNSACAAMGMVADGLDTSTAYFSKRGMVGVVEDVERLIRRRPFHVLVLGVSLGYLLSRSRKR
ncbi:MAG TPA: hypothetical protein VK901_12500 [Nitrospiraceae bacterium]|nr:hypothetical protein [Nitrospiraceae bacterium]